MSVATRSVCSKCFDYIDNNLHIICTICHRNFHNICANIDNLNALKLLNGNRNIVFNCDNCLSTSCGLVSTVYILSSEVNKLKSMVIDLSKIVETNINNKSTNVVIANNNALTNNSKNAHIGGVNKHIIAESNDVVAASANTSHSLSMGNDAAVNNLGFTNSVLSSAIINADRVNDIVVDNTTSTQSQSNSLSGDAVNAESHLSPVVAKHGNFVRDEVVGVVGYVNNNTQDNPMSLANGTNVHSLPSKNISCNANINMLPSTSNATSSEWVNASKKKNKQKRFVVGESDNTELDVIVRKQWVHLSSFKPSVTEDHVKSYVAKRIDVGAEHIVCFKLIKKGVNLNDIDKINFKLGISSTFYDRILNPTVWPSDIKVRPFKNFRKKSLT